MVDQVPVQDICIAPVLTEGDANMVFQGANIEVFTAIPLADVVCDEAPLHDLDLEDDWLQQKAQAEVCPSGEETKLVDDTTNGNFFTQVSHSQFFWILTLIMWMRLLVKCLMRW